MLPQQGVPQTGSGLVSLRKPCNCIKTHCLKLYCECFAEGRFCQNCNCRHCMNNCEYEEERGIAIKRILWRNPTAFQTKIFRGVAESRNARGCNCKRSGCLKNYCECYEAKVYCSNLCRCLICRNKEDSIERGSLTHLGPMGSFRSRRLNVFRKDLIKPQSEIMPHAFITWEAIEATANCLLAQAVNAELRDFPQVSQERLIIEEFSRSLDRFIEATCQAQPRTNTSLVPTGPCRSDDKLGGIGIRGGNADTGNDSIHRSSHRHHGNNGDDLFVEDNFQDFLEEQRDTVTEYGGFEEEGDDIDLLD